MNKVELTKDAENIVFWDKYISFTSRGEKRRVDHNLSKLQWDQLQVFGENKNYEFENGLITFNF